MIRDLGHSVIRDVGRLIEEGTSAGASDEQLLARFTAARDRSSAAFEAIVRRHGPMVLETCRRLLGGDHHAAEDALQATFLVLARRADAGITHPSGSLGPWLHEVACRTARKARVARIRRENRELHASPRPEAIVAASGNPVDDADDHRILHEEVSRLPAKHRAAIVLCYFEGMTHEQAAASLRWPVGTVRGYLARARDLLRTRLSRRGVAPAVAIGLMESRATAALPPLLIETMVRGIAPVSAGSTGAALGGLIGRAQAISRIHRSLFAALLLATAAGGAALIASRSRDSSAIESAPQAAAIEPARRDDNPVRRERVDLQGDPLPDGALARLGTVRFNHGNTIQGIAYTPDGKELLSLGGDEFVRVWDSAAGRLLRTITINGGRHAHHFALAPDGKSLFSADCSAAGIFQAWDVATGRELRRLPIPEPRMYFSLMKFSPDGKTLMTALFDKDIVFRDPLTFAEVRRIKLRSAYFRHMAFSPDGRLLAGTSEDRLPHMEGRMGGGGAIDLPRGPATPDPSERASLVIWDVARTTELLRIDIKGTHPDELAFSPDGRSLVAPFCDGTIRFYDVGSGHESSRLEVDGCGQCTMAFSPDGRILATGDDTNDTRTATIHLWDLRRKAEIRRLFVHHDPHELVFSPDGKTLASAQWEKLIRLWDVDTGREKNAVPTHRTSVAGLVISPADNSVITGGFDRVIRKWDPETGRELAVLGTHSQTAYELAISPDGHFLISSGVDIGKEACLTDLTGGPDAHRVLTINPGSRGKGVAFSPDGRLAFTSGKISEVARGQEVAMLLDEAGKPFHPWADARFLPDGTGLVATDGGDIWVWGVTGGRPIRKLVDAPGRAQSLAVSPDGRLLLVGGQTSERIQLWRLPTAREVESNMRHDSALVVAAFSPDSRLIVSGSGSDSTEEDPSVRIWEVASGQEVRRFEGHRAGINSVAFFPDGHRVASAGSDAIAMVWDLALQGDGRAIPGDPSAPLDLEGLWAELGSDAAHAYRAIWRMSAAPELAVPSLAERLRPIRPDDPDRDTSLGPIAKGETLRRLRAIAVLDKINTPAARRVLQRLATGLEGARETRDARAALRRAGP